MKCPSCSKELAEDSRFCSGCGSLIQAVAVGSLTQEPTAAIPSPAPAPAQVSTPQARFVPGTVLSERYRIVAQVGRGGMGEVYRADDLRLGQTVALKFLPVLRGKNPDDLAQLHREVRIARQISHPNVCRVFDIGDADGVPFITMEFVDGEDLASLMKRIGRLQPDKSIQLAQQLCAGLAEAHSFGVLHRDLKPANIMLDGRGNARITDFGLAIMAEEARGEDAWAGTPAYMAPEQLSGTKPTTQTDIYALGLVLYELFTGKEAYSGASLAEILQQRQKGAPAKISGIVKGLDPAIERIILQCLEKDARSRPRTVQQVAAALPGGDPLAAVIAAGETPSPEMVAAAIGQPLTTVRRLWLLFVVIIVGIFAVTLIVRDGTVLGLVPLENNPLVMEDRARQIASDLGYQTQPADSVGWYEADRNYMQRLAASAGMSGQYRQAWSAKPGPWRFIFRQSPRPLATLNPTVPVSRSDPPSTAPGMITIVLDAKGKPLYFSAVPQNIPGNIAPTPRDWAPLLSNVGLNDLVPAAPGIMPLFTFDSISAWNGRLAGENVHVVAAAYKGQPTYFEVIDNPVSEISQVAPYVRESTITWLSPMLLFCLPVGWLLLARRNVCLGRVDHKGATRVAVVIFACIVLRRALTTHYVGDAAQITSVVIYGVGGALYGAVIGVYLSYLGLEPYVRRRWPRMLISWSRILSGRFSDPRVGIDMLAGCAAGVILSAVRGMPYAMATWLNLPGQAPLFPYVNNVLQPESSTTTALRGIDGILFNTTYSFGIGLEFALASAAILLIARLLLRRDWIAAVVLGLISFVITYLNTGFAQSGVRPVFGVTGAALSAAIILFVLFRLGILGLTVTLFTNFLIGTSVITLDFSRWYVLSSVVALAILAVLVIHSFRAALAGRPLFGRAILED